MDYKLDASGDIDLSSGDFEIVEGDDEVAQYLVVRINLQVGEIDHAPSIGVPWFENVLVVGPSDEMLRFAFLPTLEQTPGIEEVTKLEFSDVGRDRRLTVTGQVTTEDGPVDFTTTIESV